VAPPVSHLPRLGFTLIELLAALVISGIVTTIIYQLLLGQGRFARLQTAREEVQQNARTALELIASELRGLGNEAISAGSAATITFRTPLAYGLVCGYLGNNLVVLFPEAAREIVVAEWQRTGDRTVYLAAPAESGSPTQWTFLEVTDATAAGSNLPDGIARCTSQLQPEPVPAAITASASRVRVFSSKSVPIPPDRASADPVYLFRDVTYDKSTSTVLGNPVPGSWIRRNSEPVAGPVAADRGLRFSYFAWNQATSTEEDITAEVVADQGRLRAVTAIWISIVAQSRARFNNTPQSDSASTRVSLRNRN
jgi:prepilin-type N-terminal cleavage/methylation domain-containing protein